MKPANATFQPLATYRYEHPGTLDEVMDFSRGLEDLAYPVIQPWAALPLDGRCKPPTPQSVRDAGHVQIGQAGQGWRAWLCAHLQVPALARLLDPASWGQWRLQLDSDGLADVYVDGQLRAKEMFLHGQADLVPACGMHALPWVCLSLDTTIQNVKLEMARCSLSGLSEINDLVRDVARSLRTAASLLHTSNRRIARSGSGEVAVNRSPLREAERAELLKQLCQAAATIDVAALLDGKLDPFLVSLHRCREALGPLAAFARRFTVFLLGVSHMDLAWKWRWGESVECMRGTLAAQVRFMKEHPDFVFLESSPPVWNAMKQRDPQLYCDIIRYGRKGRFEPAGGMWCEPDGQMLCGESWVRQLLHGQRAAGRIMGRRSRYGYNTDAFGFTWALPKIYAQAGMEAFVTQKLRYNEFTIFPEVLFWWEGDDGSRILGLHLYPDHYQEIDVDEIAQAARIFHLTSGVFASALVFGIGNHGGGPQPDMFDRIREMQEKQTVCPTVRMGGMHDYLNHLHQYESEAMATLPVIKDELFLECHHKTYTVQGRVKSANRKAERDLHDAEALAVMARLDTSSNLRPAWEITLFNHFHDILPGSSFPMVYQDVHEDYAKAFARIDAVKSRAVRRIVGSGKNLFALNTLPWRRSAAVTFNRASLPRAGIMTTDAGQTVPFQQTGESRGEAVAVLPELPALGVRSITDIRPTTLDPMTHSPTTVVNRFFSAQFDPQQGVISSLQLPDGTELCSPEQGIGRLDLLEDRPTGSYQTWNMNLTGREDQARCDRFELIEAGPVRVRFRAHLSFGLWEKKKEFMVPVMWHTPGVDYPTSFFVIDYTIYADLPWIECILRADWWEDHTDLKVAAYTSFRDRPTRAFYGIPFGRIERPTKRETPYEKARFEVPGHWADLTDGRHGLAILNTSRHGHDAMGNRLRLTLLTSPCGGEKVHVTDPLADRGRHEIHYAFYPHAGGPDDANVSRIVMEYEHAAIVAFGETSTAPIGKDLVAIDPERILATAVKPAEDGRGFLVRCFEPRGRAASLRLSGEYVNGTQTAANLLEEDQGPPPNALAPRQLATVRIAAGK